jgi:hypothetical protein
MSLVVVCGFAVYMVFLTYDLVKDSQQRYELLIDGDQISLSSYDKQQRSRINQQISLREVTSAEYYEPRDTSSLLLKGRSTTLEIPLWSFGPEAEKKIVLHVKKMGVQIVGIPNDVVI